MLLIGDSQQPYEGGIRFGSRTTWGGVESVLCAGTNMMECTLENDIYTLNPTVYPGTHWHDISQVDIVPWLLWVKANIGLPQMEDGIDDIISRYPNTLRKYHLGYATAGDWYGYEYGAEPAIALYSVDYIRCPNAGYKLEKNLPSYQGEVNIAPYAHYCNGNEYALKFSELWTQDWPVYNSGLRFINEDETVVEIYRTYSRYRNIDLSYTAGQIYAPQPHLTIRGTKRERTSGMPYGVIYYNVFVQPNGRNPELFIGEP